MVNTGILIIYTLWETHIAMENHHFQQVNQLQMAIFQRNQLAGLRWKQGYRRFLWHIPDLVMEVTMCCKPTILVYVGIWVLYFCCCKMRPNVLWRNRQSFHGVMANFYSTTQRVDFGCILFSNELLPVHGSFELLDGSRAGINTRPICASSNDSLV